MPSLRRGGDAGNMTIVTSSAPTRPLYWRLWAGVPKELLYLLIAFPIGVAFFAVTIGLFSAAVGTVATFFLGVIFLIAVLYVARGAGMLELALLGWVGRPDIRRPDWNDRTARTGFFGWLRALFGNGHYWLYLVWSMIVNFIVTTFSFTVAITWFATALGGITGWIWMGFIPNGDRDFFVSSWLVERVLGANALFDPAVADTLLWFVVGLIFTATLPFVTRGLTWMHWGVARGLLGAFRTDALEKEVATLTESRSAAVAAEGTALRRLERDKDAALDVVRKDAGQRMAALRADQEARLCAESEMRQQLIEELTIELASAREDGENVARAADRRRLASEDKLRWALGEVDRMSVELARVREVLHAHLAPPLASAAPSIASEPPALPADELVTSTVPVSAVAGFAARKKKIRLR